MVARAGSPSRPAISAMRGPVFMPQYSARSKPLTGKYFDAGRSEGHPSPNARSGSYGMLLYDPQGKVVTHGGRVLAGGDGTANHNAALLAGNCRDE